MLMLVSVQEEYSCLRVCFEQHLKMIEIQDLGVRKHEYNKVISDRAHSLKLKKQDRPKGQFIKKVSEIMNDRGRDKAKQTGLQSSYHVEEELHIEEPRELAQLGKFVTLFDLKQQRKSKGRSRNKEEWITVRMSSG